MPDAYPLTMGQLSMWRDIGLRPATQLWESNLEPVWLVPSGASTPDVRRAITSLAARHESLRTVYQPADDPREARQVVLDTPDVRFGEAAVREPFDLTAGPAWRAWVQETNGVPARVHLLIHHIVADGAGLQILESDFPRLLRGEPLEPAPQPRDLAARQRDEAFQGRLAAAAEYRTRTVAAAPPRPAVARGPVVRADAHTGIPYEAARRAAQRLRVTLPNFVLAAYGQALAAATGSATQLLWVLAANRLDPAVRGLVSSMTQWVPLVASYDADHPLRAGVRDVNAAALRALQHGVSDPYAVSPDLDHGAYFTFVPAPADADPTRSEPSPRRIESLPPRGWSGPSFYVIARAHPHLRLTARVMRTGYEHADLEGFLTLLTDVLVRAVEDVG